MFSAAKPSVIGRRSRVQVMSARQTYFDQETRTRFIDYSMEVEGLRTPDEVLNRLDEITSEKNPIRVHGANRFSVKVGDWRRIELGKNVFVHRDVPRGWLEEWAAFVASGHPIGLMTARTCLAPFTWTELSRMLDPVGIDRWPFELALKHGMRDGYVCPVGGRWVVAYWSPGVLGNDFTQQARGLLYMAASAAAVRLERLVGHDVKTRWFKRGPDPKGAVGIATGFDWSDVAGDRKGARPGRRNGPQPFQEGTSKARDPQSHAHSRRSHARPFDYLRPPLRLDRKSGGIAAEDCQPCFGVRSTSCVLPRGAGVVVGGGRSNLTHLRHRPTAQ